MTEEFFLYQKSYGNTTRMKFFYTQFFFQLQVRAYLAVEIQKKIGTIKDFPIWFFGNKEIFVSQNSYGNTMVWIPISSDFFDFARVDRKSIEIGYKPDNK